MKTAAKILCVALVGIAMIAAVSLFAKTSSCVNFRQDTLKVPSGKLSVAVVKDPAQQAKGLAGCVSIPEKSGMYFPFEEPRETTFWMKDMLIPIDIIWIKDDRIVGVDDKVPYPKKHETDKDSRLYKSPGPVDAVLEVASGKAESYGLVVGAEVR